jgi:hypothetical protein
MRIPAKHVDQVLRAVGATTSARGPEETFNHVLEDGGTVALAGGHQLARRRVAGEQRIEFIPKDKWAVNRGEMDRLGLIEEQIQFARRYFVPNEEAAGVPVLDKILKRWPALEGGGPEAGGGGIKPPGGGPRSMASMADDARERLRARGRNNTANDLGSAAAQGAGTFRDLAIIGAELLGRGIRRFGTWAREMAAAVGDFVVGLGDRLRQVWNQAQALFRQKRREGATAATPEAEARGAAEKEGIPFVKTRAMRDRLRDLGYSDRQFDRMTPEEAYRTMNEGRPAGAGPRVAGERTPPGARPRVDTKVEELRDIAPGVKLSRDAPRTWKSLDPTIQNIIDRVLSDPEREAAFYSKARSGKLSDAEIQALDAIVSGKREAADTLRAELNNATGAAADRARAAFVRAAYDQAIADLAKAARSDVEAGTRLARALAARARVMEAAGVSTPEQLLRRVFREIPDITDAQAAELVDILQNDPAKLTDALIALTKPSFFKKWLEFWKAGLVSAPGTQVANILGNVGEASLRPAESAIASLLDRLVPGGASRLKGEARAELLGSVRGALAGLGDLGATLRDIAALRPEEIDLTQPLERQVPAIGGAWGRFIRTPFRLLGAFDDWFKEIGGSAELHKLAWRRAGGDAARAAEIMADPPADLVKQVVFARKARTFQDPNRLAEDIIRLRNDQPWLHLIAPFVRTPANIARAAWQRSPAGFWAGYKALSRYRQAIGGGADAAQLARLKGEAVDALSKPILGTMILGSFAVAAKAGHMTGSGPVNPNERNALRDTGWQPYSFVVDVDGVPTYVPYNRFEPVSTLLGISADMVEAADQKTAGDLFDKGIGSIVQNFISKTYLQGLADAAEFINDPKRFASQYLSGFASSTVPNIVRKAAQAYDPIVRETKPTTPGIAGIPERLVRSVQSGVPGLSERLPARKTITGEPVERPEAEAGVAGALARFALPSIPTSEKPEAQLEKVMNAVGYVPSPPSRTVTIPGGRGRKMQLTDDDVATLDEGDQKAAQILQAYLEGGRFDRLPDTVEEGGKRSKEGVIRQVYEEQRDLARRRLFRDPDFRARMRDQNTSMTEAFEEARP